MAEVKKLSDYPDLETLNGLERLVTLSPSNSLIPLSLIAAYITAQISDAAPEALDTLNELAAALGDDPDFAATVTSSLALKAPLASPTFTGAPTAPTPTAGDNSTKLATTAYVDAATSSSSGPRSVRTITTSGTLQLSDSGGVVLMNNDAPLELTIPPNSSVAFETYTQIDLAGNGVGQVEIKEGAGVTINSEDGYKKLNKQYSTGLLLKTGTDTWLLSGSLKA